MDSHVLLLTCVFLVQTGSLQEMQQLSENGTNYTGLHAFFCLLPFINVDLNHYCHHLYNSQYVYMFALYLPCVIELKDSSLLFLLTFLPFFGLFLPFNRCCLGEFLLCEIKGQSAERTHSTRPRGKSKVFIVVCAAVKKCGEKPAVIENGEARYNLNTGIMLHVFSLLWKYFISLLSVVTC